MLCSRSHTLQLGQNSRFIQLMDRAQFGSNSQFGLANIKMVAAFEPKRALLYSRLVLDQRGRQFESRASTFQEYFFFCTLAPWMRACCYKYMYFAKPLRLAAGVLRDFACLGIRLRDKA